MSGPKLFPDGENFLPTSGTSRIDFLPTSGTSRIDFLPTSGTSRIDSTATPTPKQKTAPSDPVAPEMPPFLTDDDAII